MTSKSKLVLASADSLLLSHWKKALGNPKCTIIAAASQFPAGQTGATTVLWVDLAQANDPNWSTEPWASLLHNASLRIIAASSSPQDDKAIAALDAGCAAYCHAYSDASTLQQIQTTVESGQVWIGKTLMQRLLASARTAKQPVPAVTPTASVSQAWHTGLTEREREVAILAANGASNQQIAQDCDISERTVKAHLSAVFSKLNLTDRLQLALRVHGIH